MSIIAAIALLLGNAFFVGAEFSLIAARITTIEPLAAHSRRAQAAARAMHDIPLMIAGAQLGITLCSLGLGAIAEPAIGRLLEAPFHSVGLPEALVHPMAFIVALALVVCAHTVIGEMVPKNLTLASPEQAVLWLGPPMLLFCLSTRPVLTAMRYASKIILRLWSIETTDSVKTVFTAKELANLAVQARTEGLLDPEEAARIAGALALSQRTARDVLRPWSVVATVFPDVSPASLEVLATKARRSRFPVVERNTNKVLGFIHVKDTLGITGSNRTIPISVDIIRPIIIVSSDRILADLLLAMRKGRHHLVLVCDDSKPVGIVTLDDILTAVVGGETHTERTGLTAI